MKKIIKQWGNSLVIAFTKEEVEAYNLKVGDVIDMEDIVITKQNDNKAVC